MAGFTQLHTLPSGLSPKEHEIMAMWDGGMSIEQIARARSTTPRDIRRTVSTYADTSDGRVAECAARQASDHLLRAIRKLQGASA